MPSFDEPRIKEFKLGEDYKYKGSRSQWEETWLEGYLNNELNLGSKEGCRNKFSRKKQYNKRSFDNYYFSKYFIYHPSQINPQNHLLNFWNVTFFQINIPRNHEWKSFILVSGHSSLDSILYSRYSTLRLFCRIQYHGNKSYIQVFVYYTEILN